MYRFFFFFLIHFSFVLIYIVPTLIVIQTSLHPKPKLVLSDPRFVHRQVTHVCEWRKHIRKTKKKCNNGICGSVQS